ncbi:MAG: NifB/NifX family molybdenum-iron cluster-binding protein [Anaerolineaceae bacterium]
MDKDPEMPGAGPIPVRQPEIVLGLKLRELRAQRGLSLRGLAELSGLNINTLSLIENGRTSPSVGTLHQLAQALDISVSTFFESDQAEKRVVFTPTQQRPLEQFGSMLIQNLGKNLVGSVVQPFVVTLKSGMGSGESVIVHTGCEFVYCLSGTIRYQIEETEYLLNAGDSLLFQAHLPHCWENAGTDQAQILLIFYPSDTREAVGGRHFAIQTMKKEINMKIAAITEDGKTISQHFGRAPYYLVMTIEEGKIVSREMRSKMGHNQFHNQDHETEAHGAGHGLDASSHDKHMNMAEAISDCKALLCGGMGMGAYDSMRRLNIKPVVTNLQDIEEAAQAFIDGKLIDHTELLH